MAFATQSPFASASSSAGIIASTNAHPGKFAPGTKVQVGSHRVIVEKYLSEGGFAHVYVVRVPTSNGSTEAAVLKRVAVPDKDALANMRTEVETMKKLKGHKRIVTYIDSHASQLKGGGYEVFLLMEYCDGGGLIDFMNTRLKNRLTEPEILHIFSDAAEGVACMHYLKPPLMHRDLKVENILISTTSSGKIYKLCDFGSSAPPIPAATSATEGRLIEEDIQKHTTLQYRSPEMIDVYQKKPIDEKSDIWALGVLLYKLCYYTTPFEQQGQMAIMKASFKYPPHPKFSDRLKKLIATMLTQDPRQRPNIYQVIVEVCSMRGTSVPLKDIYATRSTSEARNNQKLPDRETNIKSPPQIGAVRAAPEQVKQDLPEVTPMRRGRPTSTSQPVASEKPTESSSKATKDPFAALDSPSFTTRSKAVDELSSRFPSAEQFALLQDKPSSFQFQATSSSQKALNTSATNALADEVFTPSSAPEAEPMGKAANAVAKAASSRQARPPDSPQIKSVQKPNVEKPLPQRPNMVSTGTMTSAPNSPKDVKKPSNLYASRPIWRVPPPKPNRLVAESDVRTESASTQQESDAKLIDADSPTTAESMAQQEPLPSPEPVSSRPSLEGVRPSLLDLPPTSPRSRSADDRSVSPTKSGPDYDDDVIPTASRLRGRRKFSNNASEEKGSSDLDYLRAVERENYRSTAQKPQSSLQRGQRTSMPVMPKPVLSGKFGGAYRRFEAGNGTEQDAISASNSGGVDEVRDPNPQVESADQFSTDQDLEEGEDLSPEARRELERRRLSLEEKRVANAGAAYKQQLLSGNKPSTVNRSSTIKSRVANLLDESDRSSPVKRTAEGYGRFTGSDPTSIASQGPNREAKTNDPGPTTSARTASPNLSAQQSGARPSAPPKPAALRNIGTAELSSQSVQSTSEEGPQTADSTELDFARRYPNLSLDIVESEIQNSQQNASRGSRQGVIRDV